MDKDKNGTVDLQELLDFYVRNRSTEGLDEKILFAYMGKTVECTLESFDDFMSKAEGISSDDSFNHMSFKKKVAPLFKLDQDPKVLMATFKALDAEGNA